MLFAPLACCLSGQRERQTRVQEEGRRVQESEGEHKKVEEMSAKKNVFALVEA